MAHLFALCSYLGSTSPPKRAQAKDPLSQLAKPEFHPERGFFRCQLPSEVQPWLLARFSVLFFSSNLVADLRKKLQKGPCFVHL